MVGNRIKKPSRVAWLLMAPLMPRSDGRPSVQPNGSADTPDRAQSKSMGGGEEEDNASDPCAT